MDAVMSGTSRCLTVLAMVGRRRILWMMDRRIDGKIDTDQKYEKQEESLAREHKGAC